MGCLTFVLSFIVSMVVYALPGGLIGQWIINSRGIQGTDTNYVFMPIFFMYIPLLSFLTACLVTFLVLRSHERNQQAQTESPNEE
ncbi:hypothetical protein [Saccharibacillus sacchari]|uniref:hypothetical protein n=1 Tax=Saccharibacillus sacchari TaxID=456493 RepID=UPI0004B459FE|nr:hypothetical protein [Saccharibacillus sacchari]